MGTASSSPLLQRWSKQGQNGTACHSHRCGQHGTASHPQAHRPVDLARFGCSLAARLCQKSNAKGLDKSGRCEGTCQCKAPQGQCPQSFEPQIWSRCDDGQECLVC